MGRVNGTARRKEAAARAARDQIVLDNLSLVKAIAIRVHENLPVHVDLDDLVHAGVLGLFDAASKYNPDKKVVFQGYAKHRVKGAILDSLRQLDWASRNMRKHQKRIETVSRELTGRLGRTPTEQEVAREMGISVERLRRLQMELCSLGLIAVTPRNEQDNQRPLEFIATPELRPDHMCEHRQLQTTLARAIGTLPARYQKVVFLYYTNEMTMKEIGDQLGVNESRISQIHKTALKKMAVALESAGIRSVEAFQ